MRGGSLPKLHGKTGLIYLGEVDFSGKSVPKLSRYNQGLAQTCERTNGLLYGTRGAMKIVAYDGDKESKTYGKIVEVVASEDKFQIVTIPGHYWHGTKTLGNNPSLTMYFVNNLYDYKSPDEERRAWNDASIKDPKTNLAYDWNLPPHK